MTGMQWKAHDESDALAGASCVFVCDGDVPESRLDVYERGDGEWAWSVLLYASSHKHKAYGYGCANESKARFMAMSLVSALLQIIEGVRPHEDG